MMSKLIIISGTPGVGKSTLAKKLAKELGFQRIDLHDYYRLISVGYNKSKKSYDIDFKKFKDFIRQKKRQSKTGLIVDSHIVHLLPKRMVDLCVVLTCSNLKLLKQRLKRRGYSEKKIRENLDAEIFQICLMEAKEKGHKVIEFDSCNDSIRKIMKEIKDYVH